MGRGRPSSSARFPLGEDENSSHSVYGLGRGRVDKESREEGKRKREDERGALGGEGNDDRWREGEGCLECPPLLPYLANEEKVPVSTGICVFLNYC